MLAPGRLGGEGKGELVFNVFVLQDEKSSGDGTVVMVILQYECT